MKQKQILIWRNDLKVRKGKFAAQLAHASLKATLDNLEHPNVKQWLNEAFTKIVVRVENEEELFEVLNNAKAAGLISALITDSGLTEFNGVSTNTCIAVGPATQEELEPVTGHLKLL
jgi:PTH2 family peptidyl-tRNA hydrolase